MTVQQQERRRFRRVRVACPVTVFSRAGEPLATGRCVDLSDGGARVSLPARKLDGVSGPLNIAFAVHRRTPNTFMVEDVACQAVLLRQEPIDASQDGTVVAMQFVRPLDLALDT